MTTSALIQGLSILSTCIKHSDLDGVIVLTLPRDSWTALWYEFSKERVVHSERNGMGGILVDYPPPAGESYGTGFWCVGCWVKCQPGRFPVDSGHPSVSPVPI